jgi:hypothetical protein
MLRSSKNDAHTPIEVADEGQRQRRRLPSRKEQPSPLAPRAIAPAIARKQQ